MLRCLAPRLSMQASAGSAPPPGAEPRPRARATLRERDSTLRPRCCEQRESCSALRASVSRVRLAGPRTVRSAESSCDAAWGVGLSLAIRRGHELLDRAARQPCKAATHQTADIWLTGRSEDLLDMSFQMRTTVLSFFLIRFFYPSPLPTRRAPSMSSVEHAVDVPPIPA